MNKPLFYTICTFSVGIFIIVWLFFLAGVTPNESVPITPPEETTAKKDSSPTEISEVATPTISHYLLTTHQNKIAIYTVYSDGNKKLNQILDVNVNSLRTSDRSLFDEGIVIKSRDELSHIIEDYVS